MALVRLYSKSGEPEEAIPFAIRQLDIDRSDPQAHDLMDLYLRANRPRNALRQYEEMRAVVETVPPNAESLQRRAERELRLASVEPLPRPVGRHVEAARASRSPLPMLPRPMNRFFGRERELWQIADSIRQGDRLISLLGFGGCGKTRLALEAAWRLAPEVGEGLYFVSLEAVKQVDELIAEIGRAVLPKGELSRRALIDALRLKPRVLLVLDDLEQLELGCADELRAILEAVPQLQCIATSRAPLRIEGEIRMPIAPMPLPAEPCSMSLPELAGNPSVALFVARAQSARPDFQLTERGAVTVAKLCCRLEGIPLALELTASWARSLTPGQMLEQLVTRFDLLESRRKDIGARHRSMRAALDESIALLPPEERDAFIRISSFQNGWTLPQAQHLCPDVDVLPILDSLAERSLIWSTEAEDRRFGMLDLLRSYAHDSASADLGAECGWLHADYFLAYALGASLPDIETEYPNLLAALRWLHQNGHTNRALRVAVALTPYWEARGRIREGRDWLELLLQSIDPADVFERAQAQSAAGRLAWLHGDYAWASEQFEEALAGFRSVDAKRQILDTRFNLQMEAQRVGEYERVIGLMQDNLKLAEELEDRVALSHCWLSMGNASIDLQRWDQGREQYELSLRYAREIGDKDRIGQALNNLGNLAATSGKLEAARRWLMEALSLFQEVDHHWHRAISLLALSKVDLSSGDHAGALRWLLLAMRAAPEEHLVVWRVYFQAAFVFAESGHYGLSAQLFGFVDGLTKGLHQGVHGIDVAPYEHHLDILRSNLPPSRIEELWEIGQKMTAEEAIAIIAQAACADSAL